MNPFIIKGYVSPEYFCDREKEAELLLENLQNNADTTLISPRKFGKTGLILHVFDKIARGNLPFKTVYVDIFSTLCLENFVTALSEAIMERFPEKTSIGRKFLRYIRNFRPVISYDRLTGSPQFSFEFQNVAEKESTLKGLFEFLNAQEQPVVLAIDEFQQITEYPEKNVEALLRSLLQQMHNIRLVFCGSKRKIMTEMFSTVGRPFFSSTRTLSLSEIDNDNYKAFIKEMFCSGGVKVDDDTIQYVLDWTLRHTFYTQSVCNALYTTRSKTVTIELVNRVCAAILKQESVNYLQIRDLVTKGQWNLLIALAKEGCVQQITAASFLKKHKLGAATTVSHALKSLMEKELVLADYSLDGTCYRVYDVFLMRWLAAEYA